jgi:hypothetical protein
MRVQHFALATGVARVWPFWLRFGRSSGVIGEIIPDYGNAVSLSAFYHHTYC